jgi:hypothetical protein
MLANVMSIANNAFDSCTGLKAVYFEGNAPTAGAMIFSYAFNVIVYYLPGTTGWTSTFKSRPALLWNPQARSGGPNFGVRTNRLGFDITGTANLPIAVEAGTNLASPSWVVLASCTLTNGSVYFSDPDWTKYPARFYRIRSP